MTAKLPYDWANNTNYGSGPDAGTPTKVDPASTANGFIRGVGAAAQHVNFNLNQLSTQARRSFLLQACKLRCISLNGTAIADTAESMAAVQRSQDTRVLAIKTAQALAFGDADRFFVAGVPASITSLVTSAAIAMSGGLAGRIVAIGTGGNKATYSDDDGATWTASAADTTLAGAGCRVVWSNNAASANGTWFIGRPGSTTIMSSNNGGSVSWTTLAASLPTGVQGMAARSDGQVVALDAAATIAFDVGPSGGFLSTGGTVANAATFDDAGDIAGNGGATIYHAGRRSSGTTIQVSSSTDGVTWNTIANISPMSGTSFTARPRLMMCQTTGLLVLVTPHNSGTALYASLDGADWVGPLVYYPALGIDAFALAGGRLLMTHDDMLFASDGVGF